MPNDRKSRVLEHKKRSEMTLQRRVPALREMIDGEEVLVQSGGNKLRLYRKEMGQLWYLEFDRLGGKNNTW